MRIAVCEDRAGEMRALCDYIAEYFSRMGYLGRVETFETGEALLEAFSPGGFDLVFLDIYLPGITGMDVARSIRLRDRDCLIIFVTVSTDHTADGFGVLATGYVVKPIDQEKMDRVLHMCRDRFLKNARAIDIPLGREGSAPLPLANIRHIEIFDKSALFHLAAGRLESRIRLDEVEAMLGGEPFLRCHRSYIVNLNYVKDIEGDCFIMESDARIPIRINGKKEVKLAYARFLARRTKEKVML